MKHNGFEYVDLGLPSGTKWARCNVGANSETDYGLYFAFGETKGYDSQNGAKFFDKRHYKFSNKSFLCNFTKYNSTDGKKVLDLCDDAAHIHMGRKWHMPSSEQIRELIKNTENTWVTDYNHSGVNGRLFTSKRNGEKLFFPACGLLFAESYYGLNKSGYFWSNSVDNHRSDCGIHLWFGAVNISNAIGNRTCGLCVRGGFQHILDINA